MAGDLGVDGRPSEAPEFLTLACHSKTPDWGVRIALPHQLQARSPLYRRVRLLLHYSKTLLSFPASSPV